MITAIVLYDLPDSVGLEECRKHFTSIAPGFLEIPGFVRKQFICSADGKVAGGAYMWETKEAAEKFYNGPWMEGIRQRYGNEPRITYFETVALADKLTGKAGAME
jgi:Putative mono-oxygenase ydhR